MTRGGGPRVGAGLLALVALLSLAANLRVDAVAVSPELGPIRADLAMTGVVAGLLTSLPVICFAIFGILAPALSGLVGLHRAVALGLLAVVAGQAGRVFAQDQVTFLALSALALAGMALGNVLLPALVKLHFPDRVGQVTAWYTTTLMIGMTLASVGTAPLADAVGGWRPALAVWAVLAAICLVPWLGLLGHDARIGPAERRVGLGEIARTPTAWILTAFFALQAMQAYALFGWLPTIFVDAGLDRVTAGALLAVVAGIGVPLALVFSYWTARHPSPYGLIGVTIGFAVIGDLGLLLAPTAAPVLWAIILGIGNSSFPIYLAMIGHRARTTAGLRSLSAFTQSTGYAFGLLGPMAVGVLRDATGGWTWPLALMMAISVLMAVFALLAARPRVIEDELPAAGSAQPVVDRAQCAAAESERPAP